MWCGMITSESSNFYSKRHFTEMVRRSSVLLARFLFLAVVVLLLLPLLRAGGLLYAQKFYQCEENEVPQIKVWAAESAREGDFHVFFVYDASELSTIGVVLQVPTPEEADFTLSFVDDEKEADFSLWIVESPDKAGWRNKKKATILEEVLRKNKEAKE